MTRNRRSIIYSHFHTKLKQDFFYPEERPWNSRFIIETTLPDRPSFLERLLKEGGKRGEITLKTY